MSKFEIGAYIRTRSGRTHYLGCTNVESFSDHDLAVALTELLDNDNGRNNVLVKDENGRCLSVVMSSAIDEIIPEYSIDGEIQGNTYV